MAPESVPRRLSIISTGFATTVSVYSTGRAVSTSRSASTTREKTSGLRAKANIVRSGKIELTERLPKWLFENNRLPSTLRELAKCIREDGNDGAHTGPLIKIDAEDLSDFTTSLLERLFTEPKRLELAENRRAMRRAKQ
jgi:hypothetical protein